MRHLSLWAFAAIVVAYLVLVQGLSLLLTRGMDTRYAAPTTISELWRGITAPVGTSLLFVLVVIAVLRWWRPVTVDEHPVRRWIVVVPIIQLAAIAAATNYGGLADRGAVFTLLLLFSTLLVGFAEELLFRGVGITALRGNGLSEGKVALWSTVVFGAAHATNLISTGWSAFIQVFAAALSGYFFYLLRRRGGGILLPAVVHGLWDFALISGSVVPGQRYSGAVACILALVVLTVVLAIRRHKITPER